MHMCVCEYTHIHTYQLLEIEAVMPGARKPTYLWKNLKYGSSKKAKAT